MPRHIVRNPSAMRSPTTGFMTSMNILSGMEKNVIFFPETAA
jgi:hypothetical protein